ncbi:ABC transporter permease [Pediococcus claussenii]|uniref:Bacterial ABC transporter EcsB family protein n=1 Tax=Pediococcus claussenii (strain ATCC BAA-344 / DSM 14800 / JCM 18046 / KCTC 3811 / LMG 21948 / P06) TaxID=701521 RepID=G8PDS7_PEDCP|nr:ABC transporter permease [Pediococcus claussenii]AEV95412.1 bacterial ABC transporter EcsB family protein [Pediococcus claussenii ATCC BAA-344]ANZ68942.1 hypothetical protein AYR57_00770 [Pediococcus claussenii]ANZ70758.1 hypothetical protein AYR58_00770 [Pediococcus claussenii]KRN19055.1 hypothetical protein IV79_GL001717 [Pediococcus claussenii]
MSELWRKRNQAYHKMIFKYLRYVLNDHLVLAMMFFVGGVGLAYSSWLSGISSSNLLIRPLVIVATSFAAILGKPVLLLQEPDKIFLLPQENLISKDFVKHSYRLTAFSRFLIMIIVLLIATPLLGLILRMWLLATVFSLQMIFVSLINLKLDYQQFFFNKWKMKWWYKLIGAIAVAMLGLEINPFFSFAITIIIGGLLLLTSDHHGNFDWLSAISFEAKRMNGLYRFFSLFTNVPQLETKSKRRRYLDPLILLLSPKSSSPFEYIYGRTILRGGELGSLVLRLLVIAVLIIGFSSNLELKVLISAVSLYLMAVQAVAVYPQVGQNVLTKIYPLETDVAQKALRKIILKLSIGFSIVLIIASTISMSGFIDLMWIILGQIIVIFLVTLWFIPRYVKKVGEQI